MTRLPPVLSTDDLPLAELCAARLDGELFTIDDSFSPVDLPADAAQRARALAPLCHDRLIVEQRSAAWVWGALDRPPERNDLCSSLGARARPLVPGRVTVREVVITADELRHPGGVAVTSPVRTILDLTRFRDDDDLVRRLLDLTGTTVDQCLEALGARTKLANKRRAISALRRL